MTPLQMARFYAMIANGGKLVTPYVVSGVEQPGANGQQPVVLQQFPPDPPRDAGVDPAALQSVRDGLWAATHSTNGTSSGVFGTYPISIAGKTGTAEKVVNLPGYPAGHLEDQSWWCGYGPVRGRRARRLRRDRERRPRLVGRGARGAPGLREVLQPQGRPPGSGERRLIVDTRHRPAGLRSRLARRLRRRRASCADSTGCCCSPSRPSSATASGRSAGSPGSTSPATRTTSSCGRRSPRRSGPPAMLVAIFVPPSLYQRHWRFLYGGTIGRDGLRLRLRRGGARLEALDRPRAVPVPAVRVRQAVLRARDRRLPRRAWPTRRRARHRRDGRSASACVPIGLVFLQPDLGTALVYAAALIAVLFFSGVRWLHLVAARRSPRSCSSRACSGCCRRRASRC